MVKESLFYRITSYNVCYTKLLRVLIGYLRMTPFITTMGTQLIARGIAYDMSQGIAVKGTPDSVLDFGFGSIFGIPNITVVSLVILVICSFALTHTTWGRHVILAGSNKETARYSGMNVKLSEMSVYTISGLLAGIAGFISIVITSYSIHYTKLYEYILYQDY